MQDFVFAPFNIASVMALVLLALCGGRLERYGAILFAAVLLFTPLIDSYSVAGFRWAVALSSFGLLGALIWMSLKGDRWWLVLAAGCQLMAVTTHLIGLFNLDALTWTLVSIRWFSWLFLMLIALFGAWEGRALTRIAREQGAAA